MSHLHPNPVALTWWGHAEGFTKDSLCASPQLPQAHSKHAFTQPLGWGTAGEQGASGPRWLVECVNSRHAAVEISSGIS